MYLLIDSTFSSTKERVISLVKEEKNAKLNQNNEFIPINANDTKKIDSIAVEDMELVSINPNASFEELPEDLLLNKYIHALSAKNANNP